MNKLRFFKVSPSYLSYLDSFYGKNSNLHTLDYTSQFRALVGDCFGWADFWKINLENTGKYDVFESFINASFLQKKWAEENNVKYSHEGWQLEILERQILEFKPDILFTHDFQIITPAFRKHIKKQCPSIRLLIGWDGFGWYDASKFDGCDIILSSNQEVLDFYSSSGYKTYYFPSAFESTLLQKIDRLAQPYDFSFLGSLFLGEGMHNERFRVIAGLARKTPLIIFAPAKHIHWRLFDKEQLRRLYEGKFRDFWDFYHVGSRLQEAVYGLRMYTIFANSRITFNMHIDKAGSRSGNQRLFEATGSGACLLTDWKDNITEYFEPDKEIITYRSLDECVDKVRFLLRNEPYRKQIAEAGQKRTLKDHSMQKRLNDFSLFLLNNL